MKQTRLLSMCFCVLSMLSPRMAAAEPVFPNLSSSNVTIKLGPEFSTVSSGENATTASQNKNVLNQQYFFVALAAKWNVIEWFDVVPEVRFGKINFEKGTADPNIPAIVKDASAIGGKFDLLFYPIPLKERSSLYIKGAPEFSYIYNQNAAHDVLYDSFLGVGIQHTRSDAAYRGSYLEIGYGYSERFDVHHRFKANLQLMYRLNEAMRPFINVKLDADGSKGADDIRVMYGVEIPATNIWKSISAAITGK